MKNDTEKSRHLAQRLHFRILKKTLLLKTDDFEESKNVPASTLLNFLVEADSTL